MPTFVYLGLPESHRKNIIATHMAPLEDDEGPHPRFGGFPIPETNEIGYYPDYDRDKGKVLKLKADKRDAFRKKTLADLEKTVAEADAMMAFTVGAVVGKPKSGQRIEFPKGKPVEVSERHEALIKKLRGFCGEKVTKKNREGKVLRSAKVLDVPMFEEVKDKPVKKPVKDKE